MNGCHIQNHIRFVSNYRQRVTMFPDCNTDSCQAILTGLSATSLLVCRDWRQRKTEGENFDKNSGKKFL